MALAATAPSAAPDAGWQLLAAPAAWMLPGSYAQQQGGVAAAPSVANVTSAPAAGALGPGAAIVIAVAFDGPVLVDGQPVLRLNSSGAATYASGNGTAKLLFNYTVRPGERADYLDYAGERALSAGGAITGLDAVTAASLVLPAPGSPGSLSDTSDILIDYAVPPLIPADSVDKDADGLRLGGAHGIDAFVVGNSTFVMAASISDSAVQLIRVHENGTLQGNGSLVNAGTLVLGGAADVDTLRLGNDTFAIVAASVETGVQLLRVHENGTLQENSSATDRVDGFSLDGASAIDTFVTGDGRTYAIVASINSGGVVQVIRIHENNGTLKAVMPVTVSTVSFGARGVDAFRIGDRTYALVTSTQGNGIQLFRVHDNGTLRLSESATHGNGGFDAIDEARGVDAFRMGNDTYAMVAAHYSNAAQLIRVHYDGTMEAVSSAVNGTRGFESLFGAYAVSVFNGTDGKPYAVVASSLHNGVQLIRIHDDGTLLPAGSAADGMAGPGGNDFDELEAPQGVDTFYLDGRAYAAVSTNTDNGVQLIRMSPAAATGVSTSAASGTYGPGEEIGITVAFDDLVNVTGRPELRLNSGGNASYQSGNNSLALEFAYTVGPGEGADLLDYDGRFALYGPGEIVEAATGVAADLAFPAAGLPGSLSAAKSIKVDGIAPGVLGVGRGVPDGAYREGRLVNATVTFTEPVSYSGTAPVLLLNVSGAQAPAAYASGNGSDRLVFSYEVRAGDASADLAYWDTGALSGSIADAAGNPANLTLQAPGTPRSLSGSAAIVLDTSAPGVSAVTSGTTDGAHREGRPIEIAVRFTEPVSYSGTAPVLLLNVSGAQAPAAYASGNGSDRLVFSYEVRAGDASADLAYWDTGALSGSIADAAGNPANLTLQAPGTPRSLSGSAAIVLDTSAPGVSAVTSGTTDGAHREGRPIEITVRFTEPVSYSGAAPVLLLNISGAQAPAAYASGNGSDALEFAYTVKAGDMSDDLAYWNTTALSGSIADAAGNPADLTLPPPGGEDSLSGSTGIIVDGAAPGVSAVTSGTTDGAHREGQPIEITVRFTEPVSYSGAAPVLLLNVSGAQAPAAYASGNGSDALEFAYTVKANDMSADLAYWNTTALSGSIADAAGNAANLTLQAPGTPRSLSGSAAIVLDTSAPRISAVASGTLDGAHREGRPIEIAVRFTEPVSYSGTAPVLLLNVSGAQAPAAYASGNGSASLVFAYTVRAGDASADLAYWNTTALSGSIADAAGNPAVLSLPAPGSAGSLSGSAAVVLDTSAPSVSAVTSGTLDGAYGARERIEIAVAFTEPVSYSGTAPVLLLNVSGAQAPAAYASGNGSASLVFAYTVQAGDASADLAYWNTTALSGSIADAAGNPAVLSLPAPGSAGSLSGSAAVVLDTSAPSVVDVASITPDGEYGAGERIEVAVRFTEPVSYSGAAPVLLLNVSGAPWAAAYSSGSGSDALAFAYTVQAGDMSDYLAYWNAMALSGSIAGGDGTAANLALPPPGSPGSLSASSSVSINAPGPARTAADAAFAGPNKIRIEYSAPLGPPAGHTGPVYGAITIGGGAATAAPEAGGVSGLGTAVHTILFNGSGAAAGQGGTIALSADLVGTLGGVEHSFAAGLIPVRAGEAELALAPAGPLPVVAIERDEFVRAVDATGSGDAARPAINVSGLAGDSAGTVRFPAEAVRLAASFAEVTIPPGATAESVPADGRLDLYISAQGPTARQVAGALGTIGDVRVQRLVEVGDSAAHIVFSLPVRILLVGQANSSAFYVNNTDRTTAVPILAECSADDTGAVDGQLNGTGVDECWLDSGADKVIYTYHLTLFGTATAPGGGPPPVSECAIRLVSGTIPLGSVREGARSAGMDQAVLKAGTLPLTAVTISATAWMYDSGGEAMPASATSVMTGATGGWAALDGETAVPGNGERAAAKFRVDVPADALPDSAAHAGMTATQTLTYTATCDAPSG